jgi:hypothetical protein
MAQRQRSDNRLMTVVETREFQQRTTHGCQMRNGRSSSRSLLVIPQTVS